MCYFLTYGAVLYMMNDQCSNPILVIAKTRVAPVKPVTVLKLDLTALLLAARLCKYVLDSYKDELQVEESKRL